MALLACDLADARGQTSDARDDARALGDPVFEAAALAGGARGDRPRARRDDAGERLEESTAALERLTAQQLATRLPGVVDARRAPAARSAGSTRRSRTSSAASRSPTGPGASACCSCSPSRRVPTLVELGRLGEAIAAAEEGARARAPGRQPADAAVGAQRAVGRPPGRRRRRRRHAPCRRGGAERRPADVHAAGQPGWCLGAALIAAGNPDRAVDAMLTRSAGRRCQTCCPPIAPRPPPTSWTRSSRAATWRLPRTRSPEARRRWHGLGESRRVARAAVLLARERPRGGRRWPPRPKRPPRAGAPLAVRARAPRSKGGRSPPPATAPRRSRR